MRLTLVRLKKRWQRRHAPHNNAGGQLRAMVQRVAFTPVHGMEIIDGRWWAHTAWGHHPVQWYLERAWKNRHTEDLHHAA